jgi:succinate dehydrogenase/fumarate reductase cytochrome b subunit
MSSFLILSAAAAAIVHALAGLRATVIRARIARSHPWG